MRQVHTVEINCSFHSLQRPEYYRRWHDETSDDFMFSVNGGRYLTHLLRLNEPEEPRANFFRLLRARARREARPDPPPEITADAHPLLAAARQRWPGYGRRTLRAARATAPASRRKATRAK